MQYTRFSVLGILTELYSMPEIQSYNGLTETGPIIEAELFANEESFLKMKNLGTPETFAVVKLLIDTGSNISGLDHSLIKFLSLNPYKDSQDWVHGQGGSWQVVRYSCVLYLPIFKKKALTIDVLEGQYRGAAFDGILGRDVLQFCDFRYNGINNSFSLVAKGF
jgi:hypothetical protein